MTTQVSQDNAAEQDVVSPLGMSDEEVMKLDFSALDNEPEAEAEPEASSSDEEPDSEEPQEEDTEEESEESDESEESEETDSNPEEEEDSEELSDDDEQNEQEESEEESEEETDPETDDEPDYKAQLDRILGPIKANGREIKVESVDDAIRLMQMGANYNKKMSSLKPNLKIMKLLENNKLLDESKLSFLIDLDKRNPDAIAKLVKDSGIDPMDIDTESESEYKPNTYTVNDQELVVDEVLDNIKDTPQYAKTIDVVSNKWDAASKQTIADNPNLLEVINTHIASGVYDLVSTEVENQRVFGRLTGMSDIEAYKAVGDEMDKKGAFNHLGNNSQRKENPKKTITKHKQASKSDPKTISKKRAASSKSKSSSQAAEVPNVLGMSDEEFEKTLMNQYL